MDKALFLQNLMKLGRKPRRAWSTQKDGDLWQIFWETLEQKGCGAMAITKVKGHATDEMVQQGKVNIEDKLGNDKADTMADDGVKMFGKDATTAGHYLTRRHTGYGYFIKDVHDHLIEAHKRMKYLVEAKDIKEGKVEAVKDGNLNTTGKKDRKNFICMTFPKFGDHGKQQYCFGHMIDIENFQDLKIKRASAAQIQKFLQVCTFRPCGEGEEGNTWLELYVIYKLWGGKEGIEEPARKAMKKASMREQIHHFKTTVKEIARKTMRHEDREHMKPNAEKKARLRGCGIDSYMAMVNFQMNLTEDARTEVVKAIINSQKNKSKKEMAEILKGERKIHTLKFHNAARSGWIRSLRKMKGKVFEEEIEDNRVEEQYNKVEKAENDKKRRKTEEKEGGSGGLKAVDKYFKCSGCGNLAGAKRKTLQLENLDLKSWCGKCKTSRSSSSWKCVCDKEWHRCEKHKCVPAKLKTKPSESAKEAKPGRRKRRRKKEETPGEEDYEKRKLTFARADCEIVSERGIRPSMLSSFLKRKFSHLCTEA